MKIDDDFAYLVLSIVNEIPLGRVATYGQIAKLAGFPKHARHVGKVLKDVMFYGSYPCHRVVNSNGRTAPGWDMQQSLLEGEGVVFMKSNTVKLSEYQWKT